MSVLAEVATERERQNARHPNDGIPDGTDSSFTLWANTARAACDRAEQTGTLTWLHILEEETAEAFAEESVVPLRAELVQVAAVAVRWIEAIDRRAA